MEHRVFIHTNPRQWVGALVAQYALQSRSAHPDRFSVRILNTEDYPFLRAREGELFLRGGEKRPWLNDDLQSFTPLRFMPPELMGYSGRAVVIDPDVFAVGDVWELLSRDMQGKAVHCRARPGSKGMATSVMLLDCAKLGHWHCATQFHEVFDFKHDYLDWITLKHEPAQSLGLLENAWNDFDRLTTGTKMLHNTKRLTQSWKTGLPVDFRPAERFRWFPPKGWWKKARRHLFGEYALLGTYRPHPDPNQERFFFGLLRECVDKGVISEHLLRDEINRNHIRPDALDVLERTPPRAPIW